MEKHDDNELPDLTGNDSDNGLVHGTDETGKVKPVRVLSAADIFAAEDINIVPVDVPEWGGIVYVRAMSAIQREKYIESMRKVIGTGRDATVQTILRFGSAKLAALTICDSEGKLLFDRSPDTIEKLSRKSAKAMERVIDAASKLNGLDDTDEKKKAADEAKKGSADQTAHDSALNID